ncbi:hypothetical protein [Fretibacterium fastidiosum]|uniref:hypothetical protein n=1 Tax=Fretibacterium fastidiosum TaxID=651822 RepID=UPI001AD80C81|nr:hypothetical protein [Fretibacterium fastidiosum]
MTTVGTRKAAIHNVEGFLIGVFDKATSKEISDTENGKMKAYPRERATKGNSTVSEFIKKFENSYSDSNLTCKVYKEDGTEATGQTKLSTVRESYEAD